MAMDSGPRNIVIALSGNRSRRKHLLADAAPNPDRFTLGHFIELNSRYSSVKEAFHNSIHRFRIKFDTPKFWTVWREGAQSIFSPIFKNLALDRIADFAAHALDRRASAIKSLLRKPSPPEAPLPSTPACPRDNAQRSCNPWPPIHGRRIRVE